jgi:hypothetical protein
MSGKIEDLPRRERRRRKFRKQAKARGLDRKLTAAQIRHREEGEYYAALDAAWQASPLAPSGPRKRRSAAARLRELELHPDRLERLLARP